MAPPFQGTGETELVNGSRGDPEVTARQVKTRTEVARLEPGDRRAEGLTEAEHATLHKLAPGGGDERAGR